MSNELREIREIALESMRQSSVGSIVDEFESVLTGGKMLRARLIVRVGSALGVPRYFMIKSAASVEMMHAASLLHDDVIDGGQLRRGVPSFWVARGISGAILFGDLLVCRAIEMIMDLNGKALVPTLVHLAAEMCDAEAEQEMMLRGEDLEWGKCVSIARRKTGSLFAFAGFAAGGGRGNRAEALKEAGYLAGTAYQLADDILDAYGDEETSGKTLGRDAGRAKGTAVTAWGEKEVEPADEINRTLAQSRELVKPFSKCSAAWDEYLEQDIGPAIEMFLAHEPELRTVQGE